MSGQDNKTECLIVGASGLVGQYLAKALTRNNYSWRGTFHSRLQPNLLKLDVTSRKDIEEVFFAAHPRAVFNCANLAGGVDFCEANPKKARAFHLDAVKSLADVSAGIGATFVFISTDYIFDGKAAPYREGDKPNPLNLYGRLKLEAEKYVMKNVKDHVIIRTTNVFGWDPKTKTPNYVMNLYRSAKAGKPVNAPSYLWGNPTYAGDLAQAMVELYSRNAGGVFHVVGKSSITRYEWARKACEILKADSSLVREVKDPPPNIVPRPFRSLLNTDKFTSSYRTVLHDVSDGLRAMESDMAGSESSATKK